MNVQTRISVLMGAASVAVLAMSQAAYAQTAAAAEPAAVDQVVVTGSRLTTGFTAPTPVTVVGSVAMEQKAPITMGEVTNDLPAFKQAGAGQGTRSANNPAAAQNNPNLRGLGSNRTLVLVDGRRVVSDNTAFAVDTNMIPTLMVDRLEVVTGGASAAYGSDAVAGVANFILKTHIDGIHGSIQYGASQVGNNTEKSVGLATGKSFGDRVSMILGGEWANSETNDTYYDRPWGTQEWNTVANPTTRAAGLPAQMMLSGVEPSTMTPGGLIISGPLKGTAFGPGGVPYQFQYGTTLYGANMTGSTGNPGVDPPSLHPLSTPFERYTGLWRTTFDVTPDTSLWGEVGIGHSISVRLGGNNMTQAGLIISRDNPFLPAATRNAMIAANLTTFVMGRIETDSGAFKNEHNSWGITNILDTRRAAVGGKGKLFGDWTWDFYAAQGKTKLNFVLANNESNPNVQAAVWAVRDANGNIVCGALNTNPNVAVADRPLVEPGCVAWNPFGPREGSREAYDYIHPGSASLTNITENAAALTFAGTLIDLPAGPVSAAFGIEGRQDYLGNFGDYRSVGQVFGFGSTTTYTGKNSVKEAFVEVGVPLLKDMPFARALDVNAAARRTDYRVSGAVTTWKVGANWEPNDAIRFRTTLSRDIRAPTLQDLFNVGARSLNFNIFNPINGQTGTRNQIGGGNPNLLAEIAKTFTAGVVLQPKWEWAQGFRASVDYYKIEIKQAIGSVNSADILQACANGKQDYCSLITFDNSVYGIALVKTSTVNNSAFNTDGVDLEASYRVPPVSFIPGRIDVRYLHTWVGKYEEVNPQGVATDRVGALQSGIARHSANLSVNYQQGPLNAGITARYTSKSLYDVTLKDPSQSGYNSAAPNSINKNHFPAALYFNANAQYDLVQSNGKQLQLFGVINNLLNKAPPAAVSIINFTAGNWNPYDVIGRTFRVGVRFAY